MPLPKVRLAIATAAIRARLPPILQETQLQVRSDSLHVGDRCTKRGPTKGICDLCYCLLGARTPETTKHICLDCPFTRPMVATIWRNYYMDRAQPHVAPLIDPDHLAFQREFARRIYAVSSLAPPPSRTPSAWPR